jgi:hypothetical protein
MQRFRLAVIVIVLMVLAFLAGFVPKELELRRTRAKLATASLDLQLSDLHRRLGVASHEAQRNNFGLAMTEARAFFEGCRKLTYQQRFEGQPRTKLALTAYGTQGDTILGQLANADPMAKQRLASLYLTMNGVLARRQ